MRSFPKAPPQKRTLGPRKNHGAIRPNVWKSLADNLLLTSRSRKITRTDLPREKRSTVRGKPYRQSVGKCITTREIPPPDPPARKQCLRDLPLIALPRKNVRIGRGSVRIGRGERTMSPETKAMCTRLKRLSEYIDSGTEEGKDRRNRTGGGERSPTDRDCDEISPKR